ncbi:hypothetical protein GCM10010466_41810 [Planomonospora alba]|uniref:Uncharacterized protein n=1 Tax=Planomonospora alba TaxID=161354 RepID=A0ABP6NFE0_9ACTN
MKRVLAGLTIAGAVLVASGTPVSAASPQPDSGSVGTLATEAPSCVEREVRDEGWTDELYVVNRCGETKWLKAIIAYAGDSSCQKFDKNQGYIIHEWGYPGRFDRLELC